MGRKYDIKDGDTVAFGWAPEQSFTGTVVARSIEVSDLVLYAVRQTDDRPIDKDFECVTIPEWTIRSVSHKT